MSNITYHTPMKKLSDATEFNGIVYTAGQVAKNLNAGMKAQTEDVLRQIDALLAKSMLEVIGILTAFFVASLPVKRFHGVGPVTARRMEQLGIVTGAGMIREIVNDPRVRTVAHDTGTLDDARDPDPRGMPVIERLNCVTNG